MSTSWEPWGVSNTLFGQRLEFAWPDRAAATDGDPTRGRCSETSLHALHSMTGFIAVRLLVQRQIKSSRPIQKIALLGVHLQRAFGLQPVFRCGVVFNTGIGYSMIDHTKRLTNIATL
jgi:hypothetical protein